MSVTVQAVLVAVGAMVVALAGRAVVHRLVRPERVEEAQQTAEIVTQAMAALYGVLVAFLLAGAWGRFDAARETVTLETNAAAALWQIAQVLPGAGGRQLTREVEAYERSVREEMALPGQGRTDAVTDTVVDGMWRTVAELKPTTPGQTELQAQAFNAVRELANHREARLSMMQERIPAILWLILIGGGAAVLTVVAISSSNTRLSAVYLALLTMLIAFGLYTTYALSYPGRSGLAEEMVPAFREMARPTSGVR